MVGPGSDLTQRRHRRIARLTLRRELVRHGAMMQSKPGALSFEEYRKTIMKSPAALLCTQRMAAKEEAK